MQASLFTFKSLVLGLLATGTKGNAQAIRPPGHTNFSTWWPVQEFPNAQQDNLTRLFSKADKLVKEDLTYDFAYRCIWKNALYPEIGEVLGDDGFIKAQQAFDNLYFVGEVAVSAWAIDTGDGLIIVDALYNGDEIEKVLIPSLQSLGFEMSDVKGLIITHEHIDHYGGAGYVQEKYGTTIYASEETWKALDGIEGCPVRDQTLGDGDTVKEGDYAITAYHTPGHSPGCLSLMFPVKDNGKRHLAGLYGGGGVPSAAADKVTQMESFKRFSKLVKENKADVLLSNHGTQDRSLQNLAILDNRQCDEESCKHGICKKGHCSAKNPYVVGTDYYVRYLETMSLCVEVTAARNGQDLHF
ncbi:Metallo-hydrolase/oxidoreductase [Sarocladium strictum]